MPTAPFNDAQTRHIVATLHHIDDLLARAIQIDTSSSSAQTPSAIPPETHAALSELREELGSALGTWAPSESVSPSQLRWALQTALRLAQIALGELDERHLGHYGPVNPSGLGRLDETRERLGSKLEKIRAVLERPPAQEQKAQ